MDPSILKCVFNLAGKGETNQNIGKSLRCSVLFSVTGRCPETVVAPTDKGLSAETGVELLLLPQGLAGGRKLARNSSKRKEGKKRQNGGI